MSRIDDRTSRIHDIDMTYCKRALNVDPRENTCRAIASMRRALVNLARSSRLAHSY
jgi:hypothetical protein